MLNYVNRVLTFCAASYSRTPPSRINSSSSSRGSVSARRSRSPKPTISGSVKGGRNGRRGVGADEEISDEMHMFCSSMYSHEFVVETAKQAESNPDVNSIVFEDLIQRDEAEIADEVTGQVALIIHAEEAPAQFI